MRRVFSLFVVLAVGSTAEAQDWVSSVFPSRVHDFGTVARGSKIRHSFKLVNTTSDEIHIATYRTKCGCTEVKLGAQTIPAGTQTIIEAVLDTTKFQGPKASGLTLVIDRPQFIEVDLNLNCFIRGDLTLNPGQADFGQVNRAGKPTIDMVLTYAGGRPDWAITSINTLSKHIAARGTAQTTPSSEGRVSYALSVVLNTSAPVGFFKDEVTLNTNDPTSPTIPISVTAFVQSNVSVSPSVINLGQVRAGGQLKKTILVKSSQPFKVSGAKSNKAEIVAVNPPDAAKTLHPVTFTFTAPSQPGPFHGIIEVETDVKDEPPAKVSAFATILP